MKPFEEEARALDSLIDHVLSGVPPAVQDRSLAEAATLGIVRAVREEALAEGPDQNFVRALATRLFAGKDGRPEVDTAGRQGARPQGRPALIPQPDGSLGAPSDAAARLKDQFHATSSDATRRRRPWPSVWWQRIAAVLVLIVLASAGLIFAFPARAQLQSVACLIPGLGIRSCDASSLMATRPVSVSDGGAALTVAALFSSGGSTTVRLNFARLPSPVGQLPPGGLQISLRDGSDKTYAPGGLRAVWVRPDDPRAVSAVADFAALDPALRAVDLQVSGPLPIGSWNVHVPLKPVAASKLPQAQPGLPAVTVQAITVRFTSIVATREATTVQLTAHAQAAGHGIANLANHSALVHPLTLRDDKGRTDQEVQHPLELLPRPGSGFVDDVTFPPLAPDARSVSLSIPFVTQIEETAPAVLRVPVAGKKVGDHIPLNTTVALGAHSFKVLSADVVAQPPAAPSSLARQYPGPWLTLQMDYGGWSRGRELVGPGVVEFIPWVQTDPVGAAGQFTQVSVPLSQASNGEVVVTFQNARVAIQGPWQLSAPLPAGP